eukprot:UN01261
MSHSNHSQNIPVLVALGQRDHVCKPGTIINSMLYCTVLNAYQIINIHACILAAFYLDIYTHLDPIQTDRKIIGKELYVTYTIIHFFHSGNCHNNNWNIKSKKVDR